MKSNFYIKSLSLVAMLLVFCFMAGAQVSVGPILTLPKGKSIKIVYDATINTGLPAGTTQASHQGTINGANSATVLTDDPDAAGASDPTLTVLDVPPFVVGITRKTPLASTVINATAVTYLVTFSEGVNGVDGSDFALTKTGSADGTIAGVSSAVTGTAIEVTVNGVSGDGTLRLDLNNTGTGITDDGGTAITGGFTTAELYVFDHTLPTLTLVTIGSTNTNPAFAKVGDKVTIDFTTSEATGIPTATILGQMAIITNVSGHQWKAEYTLQNADAPEGGVTFSISFSDEAGNAGTAVSAVTTGGGSVTFDKTVPVVNSLARLAPAGETTSATSVTFQITFSERTTGVDATDFILTGTVSGTIGTITEVTGSNGTVYEVQRKQSFGNRHLGRKPEEHGYRHYRYSRQ